MALERVAEGTLPASQIGEAGRSFRASAAPRGLRQALIAAAAALVSFLAAKFGLALLAQPGGVALFWPSSGLMVGALIALGRGAEKSMAAGVFAGVFAANATGDRNLLLAIAFAAVNVLEFVLVARLAERWFGRPFRLDTLRRVGGFFLAAGLAAACSAFVAMVAIAALGNLPENLFDGWHEWFRSDFIGIIGIAPLLIGLPGVLEKWSAKTHVEGFVTLAVIAGVTYGLFAVTPTRDQIWTHIPPVAALFPMLLFVAARLPLVYASAAVTVVTLCVVVTTASGSGRFSDPMLPLSHQLFFAQIVILSAAVCSLALAALVTERRRAEEQQRLLISQLDHRVKNSLALMQAVVERSQVSARSIGEFVASLGGRIRSMARTQSKLSTGKWRGLDLASLIRDELAPYHSAHANVLSGPSIDLKPAAAQAISMVVHELATNAAKYGALSRSHGRVIVHWAIESGADGAQWLTIVWREDGGPRVAAPDQDGFGMTTIRNLLSYELGGRVKVRFEPVGLFCSIALPAESTVIATSDAS